MQEILRVKRALTAGITAHMIILNVIVVPPSTVRISVPGIASESRRGGNKKAPTGAYHYS